MAKGLSRRARTGFLRVIAAAGVALFSPLSLLAGPAVDSRAPSAAFGPIWSVTDPQPSSQFGATVGTAGDVNGDGYSDMVVGAWNYDTGEIDAGRVLVYLGSPLGLETTPSWTFDGDQAGAHFGHAAATAGDVNGDGFSDLIVGAFGYDESAAGSDEGRVMVFHGSASGLGVTPDWVASGEQAGAWFGYSAATAGDVNGDGYSDVMVNASYHDNGEVDEGRVFVYHGSPSGLSATADWIAEADQNGARFGDALSTAGDVNGDGFDDVIIGCHLFDNGQLNEGRAFIFHGSSTGLASAAAWTAEGDQMGAEFASSVGTAGDVNGDGYADVVVGAPRFDNGELDEGRLYVYLGSAGGVTASPFYTRESNQAHAWLGYSVATAGDLDGDGLAEIVAGAPQFDVLANDDGIAYVYKFDSDSMLQIWAGSSLQLGGRFGESVGTTGDVDGDGFAEIVVGASGIREVSVLPGSGGSLSIADAVLQHSLDRSQFGYSVASAGDVNGDGYSDVIVGAHEYGPTPGSGGAYVYFGSSDGIPPTPDWSVEEVQTGSWFGTCVSGAGDVNGDGYADVIVGASAEQGDGDVGGAAYLYYGSPSGMQPAPTVLHGEVGFGLGSSVAGAGDVNGDGFSDVIVGAPSRSSGRGAAFVYLGSAAGLELTPGWSVLGSDVGAKLGYSVSTAGDVNGDGFSDLVIGAPHPASGGEAYVFYGSAAGPSVVADWSVVYPQQAAQYGWSVGNAGDVNGDGFSDVVIGAPDADNGQSYEGMAFVYHGSAAGLSTAPAWEGDGDLGAASFGNSVRTAGDINGDGYSDLIVGAPRYYVYEYNRYEGKAFLFLGSSTGLASSYDVASKMEGGEAAAYLGFSVGTAGDVNGDGFSDVVVGALGYEQMPWIRGRAYVYLGNVGDGADRRRRQMRSHGFTPIGPLALSDSSWSFVVKGRARSASGRARARMVVEAKPLGTPFDGTGLHRTVFVDTGDPSIQDGVELSLGIGGLQPETPYHWRVRFESASPFTPRTPWFAPLGNAVTEMDFRTGTAVTAAEDPENPRAGFRFGAPWPNPFRSSTTIAFRIDRPTHIRIEVYDARGRRVAFLADGRYPAGEHHVRWDGRTARGSRAATGVYFLRLERDGKRERSRKVLLVH